MKKQESVVAHLPLPDAVNSLSLPLKRNRVTITGGVGVLLGFAIRLNSYDKFPRSFGHAALC
jgi:hypothetical protein